MFDPDKWISAEKVLFWKGWPKSALFLNTANGLGISQPWNGLVFPKGVWTRVDLSAHIPLDAKAVNLSTFLIITHGPDPLETANLLVNLKPPSSTEPAEAYEAQTLERWVGGGQRTNWTPWVAVENAQFDFWWNTNANASSEFCVNMSLAGFAW